MLDCRWEIPSIRQLCSYAGFAGTRCSSMQKSQDWCKEEARTMATEPTPPLTIASETQVSQPTSQKGFPLKWTDWELIKRRIRQCRITGLDLWVISSSLFTAAALLALGVALSADQDRQTDTWRAIFFGISIGGGVASAICIAARLTLGRSQHERIGRVLEDMEQIEQQYPRPSTESPPEPPPKSGEARLRRFINGLLRKKPASQSETGSNGP